MIHTNIASIFSPLSGMRIFILFDLKNETCERAMKKNACVMNPALSWMYAHLTQLTAVHQMFYQLGAS